MTEPFEDQVYSPLPPSRRKYDEMSVTMNGNFDFYKQE